MTEVISTNSTKQSSEKWIFFFFHNTVLIFSDVFEGFPDAQSICNIGLKKCPPHPFTNLPKLYLAQSKRNGFQLNAILSKLNFSYDCHFIETIIA